MIKIMVVDDNALVRRAVCETIDWAAMGCEIEGRLTNGIEGFQYAKEHHPDIIITDIKMPGMDGLEMVKALKEEYDTFSSIVITGFDEFQYAQQALRLGAADILLKPIENKELVETVRRIARGSVEVRDGVGGLKGERNLSGEGKTTGNVSLIGTCSLTENQILTEMAREEHMQYLEEKKEEHYAIVVRRALAYMRENLSRKITLTELADYAGLSAAHLSRLIKFAWRQRSICSVRADIRSMRYPTWWESTIMRIFISSLKKKRENHRRSIFRTERNTCIPIGRPPGNLTSQIKKGCHNN